MNECKERDSGYHAPWVFPVNTRGKSEQHQRIDNKDGWGGGRAWHIGELSKYGEEEEGGVWVRCWGESGVRR